MKDNIFIKNDFGLETILRRIMPSDYIPFVYELKEEGDDFKVVEQKNPKFVSPILSVVKDYSNASLEESCIILIEAVGASGKTELTKKMSHWLTCPVVDLGHTKVVAGNSLTGLLFKRMFRKDCSGFMDDISEGKSTMIIDALDEGYMKTNNQGYMDFLDDVLSLEPNSKCPIIMLGRYNAVELAATFLMDKDVKFITLQIEPFTMDLAREFIDKAVDTNARFKYESIYKETRDYILDTIDGFFQKQSDIKQPSAVRFIGYAPVLMSIAKLFVENTNYQLVLNEMKERKSRSVRLIVDIVEHILTRDREEKVKPQLINMLLADRDQTFKKQVTDTVYSNDEQCARVLYKVMNCPFPDIDISDAAFLSSYNEHMKIWLEDHPFMGKKKIGNIVFESYILAKLVTNLKYKDIVLNYMKKNGISYMFTYIYEALNGLEEIDGSIMPYIYESLCELNNKQNYYELYLEYNPTKSSDILYICDFEFVGSNEHMLTYKGYVTYSKNDHVDMGTHIEHMNINIPLDFVLSRRNVEISSPSYIKCNNLIVESEEVTLHNNIDKTDIMIECNDTLIDQHYDQFLQITNTSRVNEIFKIVSSKRPEYPLIEYWNSENEKLIDLSNDVLTKYKKLRAIILEFRSHSKHMLAKHREKIDFIMGSTDVGRAVIEELKIKNIMLPSNHLYMLDTDVMDRELGLSYDAFRNFEKSSKVIKFLNGIKTN